MGKHRKPKGGKHEKKTQCGNNWLTPPKHVTDNHTMHTCGLEPNHKGKCICNDWLCGETH